MDILSAPQAKVKATRMFYFDLVSLPFASASAASRKKAVEKVQSYHISVYRLFVDWKGEHNR